MREVSISINIYCHWDVTPPVYRVYVDDDLLTERTYVWNNAEQYINEHILVNLGPGTHTLKVIEVNSEFNRFRIQNAKINNVPIALVNNQFTI